jgi:hypothetical protein
MRKGCRRAVLSGILWLNLGGSLIGAADVPAADAPVKDKVQVLVAEKRKQREPPPVANQRQKPDRAARAKR